MATHIAKELQLSDVQVEGVTLGALVHDIGKISVPAELLVKPTKLSTLEKTFIETHADEGFDILKNVEFPWPIATIVSQHHERLDGSGYPKKLKLDNISLETQIIGIADVVEAMGAHRPYRPALGFDAALKEIKNTKGADIILKLLTFVSNYCKKRNFNFDRLPHCERFTKQNKPISPFMEKIMKNIISAICALTLSFLIIDQSLAEKQLILSGHPEYPPITWKEKEKIVGVAAEMAQTIFSELDIPMNSKFVGPWKRVQMSAKAGHIDAIGAAYINEERKLYMDYSIPFIKDPVVIFVLKGKEFPFQKWDDLIGKKGTTNLGESYGEAFDQFIVSKLNMHRVTQTTKNFDLLKYKRYDYFIFGLYPGTAKASITGYDEIILPLPTPVVTADFYLTFSKKSEFKKYLPQVNIIIDRLKKDGSIAKWVDKYQKYYKTSQLKQ